MTQTLASLKEVLQEPFVPDSIQFLPKRIHQEKSKYVCLALPYANKRVYEDRLNELVFGEWSSPYVPPYAQGNKLIIPATVVILGVAHTDYGEEFLTTPGKNGAREDENTATEAYSQAFRRACAKFSLGRYLYDLRKLTLPYDPKAGQIAISDAERIAWVERLYQERGLLPKVYTAPARLSATHLSSEAVSERPAQTTSQMPKGAQVASQPATPAIHAHPTSYPNDTFLDWVCRTVNRDVQRIEAICQAYDVADLAQLSVTQRQGLTRRQRSLSPVQQGSQSLPETAAAVQHHAPSSVGKESQQAIQPTTYPDDTFLDWVAAQVERDALRIQGICTFYRVPELTKLSDIQCKELTKRLQKQARQRHLQSSRDATPAM
jgi:hypothetical protein